MNQERLQVGVDIDGVLVDTDPEKYLRFCEKEFGWQTDYETYKKTHSWHLATGQNSDEMIGETFKRFIINVEQSQKPIEGAHAALKKLGRITDIYLITARTGMLRQVTEKFIQAHLPDVPYHELSMGNLGKKEQRIVDFKLDYFIDDSYREILHILSNQILSTTIIPFPTFYGTQRWKNIKDERIHWLSVWKEITHNLNTERQSNIRRRAWEEITQVIAQE